MPLDPQAQEVLDQFEALGLPPHGTVSPEEARKNSKSRPRAPGPEVAKVENRTVPACGPGYPCAYLYAQLETAPSRLWAGFTEAAG